MVREGNWGGYQDLANFCLVYVVPLLINEGFNSEQHFYSDVSESRNNIEVNNFKKICH